MRLKSRNVVRPELQTSATSKRSLTRHAGALRSSIDSELCHENTSQRRTCVSDVD